jgi:hypothetical protein
MRNIVFAFLIALGLGMAASGSSIAAPISGAPIAQAANTLAADGIQQVWYDRYGRWHPNRPVVRGPVFVVPPPVVVVPRRAPVCRQVWVCNSRRVCSWRTRCV